MRTHKFLRHPIKFAVVDSSATPDCSTKLTIKATGRIFVGVRSKDASELQNDKKIEVTDKKVFLPCHFKEHLQVELKTADDHLMFGLLIMIKPLP